jgi:hypothetical protein
VSSDLISGSASSNPDAIRVSTLDGNRVGALIHDDIEPGQPCFSQDIAPKLVSMK